MRNTVVFTCYIFSYVDSAAIISLDRYDDTDILLKEYVENEPTSDRANSAIARINAIHQVYSKDISNAHMLYSLSLFITEPINWIDRQNLKPNPNTCLVVLFSRIADSCRGR